MFLYVDSSFGENGNFIMLKWLNLFGPKLDVFYHEQEVHFCENGKGLTLLFGPYFLAQNWIARGFLSLFIFGENGKGLTFLFGPILKMARG